MKILGLALILNLLCAASALANGDVTADLSSTSIDVNTGFTGTTLTVFGVTEPHTDIVVAVEGPDASVTIRRKAQHFGLWVADSAVSFRHAPKFYALAMNKSGLFLAEKVAASDFALKAEMEPDARDDSGEFRAALIRIEQNRGFYNFNAGTVQIKSGHLFRADFDLPVNVPIGPYRVHIVEIRDGALVAARTLPLTIDESGVAVLVQRVAGEHPFIYAFFTLMVVLVIGAGSTSFSIVRKGK